MTATPTDTGAQPILVEGFRHVPGHHCGSTALANLTRHYGLDLPEGVVFGLAAGATFWYAEVPGGSPSHIINGRALALERQFVEITAAPLELRTAPSPEESWEMARDAVLEGRPSLLLTDLYYLEHYGNSAHFPGHAVILAGFDAEAAYVADTGFPELQRTSLEALARARHSQAPPLPLSGEMLTVSDPAALRALGNRLPELAVSALRKAAAEMLEPAMAPYQGMPALRRFADEAGDWPERLDDWQWAARFTYQVIERRGTGGGAFRRLYARFLAAADGWLRGCGLHSQAEAAGRIAGMWTSLAYDLREMSQAERPTRALRDTVSRRAHAIAGAEERLWSALAEIAEKA